MDRTVKIGTEGNQIEVTLDRPEGLDAFQETGITEESLNEMLIADDKRRCATQGRSLMKGKTQAECEKMIPEIIEALNPFVFVAGRKSGQGSKKVREAKEQGQQQAVSILATLTSAQIKKLSNLSLEVQGEIMRSSDVSEAINNA